MNLYTLIIDFDGGTYVSQAMASKLIHAPSECIKTWDISDIKNILTEEDRGDILNQLQKEEFISLEGIKNVWCGTATLNSKLLTLNLVLTESDT